MNRDDDRDECAGDQLGGRARFDRNAQQRAAAERRRLGVDDRFGAELDRRRRGDRGLWCEAELVAPSPLQQPRIRVPFEERIDVDLALVHRRKAGSQGNRRRRGSGTGSGTGSGSSAARRDAVRGRDGQRFGRRRFGLRRDGQPAGARGSFDVDPRRARMRCGGRLAQRRVGEREQTARRPACGADDRLDRVVLEEQRDVARRAGARDAIGQQRTGFVGVERLERVPLVDPVGEIAPNVEPVTQLALSEQHEVEELPLRHVVVQQQPQHFEDLVAGVLRFVDEERERQPVEHRGVVQIVLERVLQRRRRARRKRQSERAGDAEQELGFRRERRVEDLRQPDFVAPEQLALELRHQARLPGPRVADDHLQTARLQHAADQAVASAAQAGRRPVEVRVRRVEKRIALQPEAPVVGGHPIGEVRRAAGTRPLARRGFRAGATRARPAGPATRRLATTALRARAGSR